MTATLQEQARALGDPTRYAIFRRVADAGRPIGIAELNEHFAPNHNAIRQHLTKLVAAGLVGETKTTGGRPGRPRLMYEVPPSVDGQWGTAGPYERLSRLLVEIIHTGLDPEEVGRRAADEFRVPMPSGDVVADITTAMARQGFDPELRDAPGGAVVVLHQCPFATAALADRHTVCALHLGIVEGLAAGGAVSVEELVARDPREAQCRVRLGLARDERDQPEARGTLTLRGRQPRR